MLDGLSLYQVFYDFAALTLLPSHLSKLIVPKTLPHMVGIVPHYVSHYRHFLTPLEYETRRIRYRIGRLTSITGIEKLNKGLGLD